jgi:hypothetical protein
LTVIERAFPEIRKSAFRLQNVAQSSNVVCVNGMVRAHAEAGSGIWARETSVQPRSSGIRHPYFVPQTGAVSH